MGNKWVLDLDLILISISHTIYVQISQRVFFFNEIKDIIDPWDRHQVTFFSSSPYMNILQIVRILYHYRDNGADYSGFKTWPDICDCILNI